MEPLAIVRKWVAPYVGESGKHEQDPEVTEAINEARRIIYPVGDWKDTIEPTVISVYSGTVTLPAWGDSIRQAWQGSRRVGIENQWFQPLSLDTFNRCIGQTVDEGLIDLGARYATFHPYDKNFRIKVVSFDPRDEGVRLVFQAISEYGEPVWLTRTLEAPHKPVTADPIADKWVQSIVSCNKPKTFDRVHVYIYDPVREFESLCAIYEATDVNPQLRRYRVPRGCRAQVFAKVKKKFVEILDDDHLVDIHTDALIHLLQGITQRKNRNPSGYASEVQAARNFLDREIQSSKPVQTHRVRISPLFHDTNLGFE